MAKITKIIARSTVKQGANQKIKSGHDKCNIYCYLRHSKYPDDDDDDDDDLNISGEIPGSIGLL